MIATADEIRKEKEREYQLEVALQRIRCEKSLSQFIQCCWEELEPGTPLVWNWHLDYLCEEAQKQIERIAEGRPREYHLIVNVPPRTLKSWIFTRAPAAWAWIRYPWMRFMHVSFNEGLALEHSVDTRTLIQSDWYQERWGGRFEFAGDQNVKSFYKNSDKGYRMTGSVGKSAVGRGGHIIGLDDPISPEESESDVSRETCIRWFSRTMRSRINNPLVGMFWVIMQRLHEEDLTGYLMREEGHMWKHICFPAIDGDQVRPVKLRKKYVNGLLIPKVLPADFLEAVKVSDPYMFAGQYLQLPSPPEGGMFKRQHWKYWQPKGMNLPNHIERIGTETFTCPVVTLPDQFDDVINSWDMGLKESKKNDPLAGEVWAQNGPDLFLIDLTHDRMNPYRAENAALELWQKYPSTSAVLIEDTAGGSAAIVGLKKKIAGVIGIIPNGDKKTRAIPASRLQEAGNLYLPHPSIAPWVKQFVDEFAAFDKGQHDDQVDACSQAINYLLAHRRVWPNYKGEHKSFKIDFQDLADSSILFVSQHVEQDLTSSCIIGLWSRRSGGLYIIDEFVSENPRPELVISGVLAHIRAISNGLISKVEHLKKFVWYGNALMANKGGAMGDLVDAYRKMKIQVRAVNNVDEFGSNIRVGLLISRQSLSIHTRAPQLRQQMIEWGIENKRPASGHGLCRALSQTVGVLWESGAMQKPERKMGDYSARKTKFKRDIEIAESQGRIPELVVKGQLNRNQNTDPSGYVV